MYRVLCLLIAAFLLNACTSQQAMWKTSELQQGRRYFDEGYYKRAMHQLLPIACDGNPQAQYAVGYMYYYGYGVAQDTDVGYFWIDRSAAQGYEPAIKARQMMVKDAPVHATDALKLDKL